MSSRNKKDFCTYCEQSTQDGNHIWCIDCGDEVEINQFDAKTCRCKECQNIADLLKYKKYNDKRRGNLTT